MILDKVKEVAKDKGMTLKEVAARSGIKYDTLLSWNEHVPGAMAVWKVSKALDVSIEELLELLEELKD